MFINLKDLAERGEDFEYTRHHRELATLLDDLLHGHPFHIQMHILPAGDAFDLKGSFTVEFPLTCSYCASGYNQAFSTKFHELLLVGTKNKCDLKGAAENFEDPELNATHLDGYQFNAGEFLHELIALQEPNQPQCREECKGLCHSCGVDLNTTSCTCAVKKSGGTSPFLVLKQLKLF